MCGSFISNREIEHSPLEVISFVTLSVECSANIKNGIWKYVGWGGGGWNAGVCPVEYPLVEYLTTRGSFKKKWSAENIYREMIYSAMRCNWSEIFHTFI